MQSSRTSKHTEIFAVLARRSPVERLILDAPKLGSHHRRAKACKQNLVPASRPAFSHDLPYVFREIGRGSRKSVGSDRSARAKAEEAVYASERRHVFVVIVAVVVSSSTRRIRSRDGISERSVRQSGAACRSGSIGGAGGCSSGAYVRVVCRRGKPVTRIKPTD